MLTTISSVHVCDEGWTVIVEVGYHVGLPNHVTECGHP